MHQRISKTYLKVSATVAVRAAVGYNFLLGFRQTFRLRFLRKCGFQALPAIGLEQVLYQSGQAKYLRVSFVTDWQSRCCRSDALKS
eukprot:507529-Amphidinium_carterae.1